MDSIPVVEVGKLVQKVGNEDTQTSFEDWLNSAKLVGDALHKIGFVYLANHGIEKKLVILHTCFPKKYTTMKCVK